MKTNEEKEHAKRIADLLAGYIKELKAERTIISLEMQKYFPQFCALLEQETMKTQDDELKELVRKIEAMGWDVTLTLKKGSL